MPLYNDLIINRDPIPPDPLAHKANQMATAAERLKDSLASRMEAIRREFDRPSTRKLLGAPQSLVTVSVLLAAGWVGVGAWEYVISAPIYEVVISKDFPWIAFIGCMMVAVYCSACLAEGSKHFSILDEGRTVGEAGNRVLANVYSDGVAKRLHGSNWFFAPKMGLIVGAIFLAGIYYLSIERVRLQQLAGEAVDDSILSIWMPVVLYGVEILLGIPAFFALLWGICRYNLRRYGKERSRRMGELEALVDSALETRGEYVIALQEYNAWAQANGKLTRPAVSEDTALTALIAKRTGKGAPETAPVINLALPAAAAKPAAAQENGEFHGFDGVNGVSGGLQ